MTRTRREELAGYAFVSPWIVGFTVFLLYPLTASLYFAFCDYSVLRPPIWTGLDNFNTLIHDDVFWTTLKNTIFYTFLSLPLGLVVALGLAMLLNLKIKGMAFYRTIFYLPSLVPLVASAVLFLWLFDSDHGFINQVLAAIRIEGPGWLTDSSWSKITLILISMWGVGNTMIIYLAGLQEVPQSLYEAADVDGAKPWTKTWAVTLPLLSPILFFNLIIGIVGSIQIFTLPYIMFPGGAPARSTYFYTAYLYDNAFKYHNMGYACAMGWIMFLIILACTLIAQRFSAKHVYYGGG